MLFHPLPGRGGQHHGAARFVRDRGGRGGIRAEGASRLDRITPTALEQPCAGGIVYGGPACRPEAASLAAARRSRQGSHRGVVLARFQPVPEIVDQLFEDDLSVEMGAPCRRTRAPAGDCEGSDSLLGSGSLAAMTMSSHRSRARSASGSSSRASWTVGGRSRLSRSLNCSDAALRTTRAPSACAVRTNVHRAFMAEKSMPETALKSSRTQTGGGSLCRRTPDALDQRIGAAEEDIAAQTESLHQRPLFAQDGSIGDGADLVAGVLARSELGLDRLHAAEADGEEHRGDQHPDPHALEKAEPDDGDEDQQDDGVLPSRAAPCGSS